MRWKAKKEGSSNRTTGAFWVWKATGLVRRTTFEKLGRSSPEQWETPRSQD